MARESKRTSITESAASKFSSTANEGAMLSCTINTGLHLIRLRGGCVWRYRYTSTIDKKRHVKTIGKFPAVLPQAAAAQAAQWAMSDADPIKDRKTKWEHAQADEKAREGKTLRRYLDGRYSKTLDTWPLESAKLDRSRLKQNFADLLDRPMDEITRQDLRDWQDSFEGKYTSLKRAYTSLKTLLRQAVRDEVIKSDPLEGFKLDAPSSKEQARIESDPGKEKRRILTPNEIERLHIGLEAFAEEIRAGRRNSRKHGKPHLPDLDIVAYPHWFVPFAHFAFHSGLRTGDLVSLTWEELNVPFSRMKKAASKSSTVARRRGGKAAIVEMKLNERIAGIMRSWWEQHGKPSGGLVFPSPVTGQQLDRTANKKPWVHVKKFAGLPAGLDFYALRHHFVSSLLAQGVPLLTVARLAGHKSTQMIEQHYGHICPDQATLAVDVLAKQVDFSKRGAA